MKLEPSFEVTINGTLVPYQLLQFSGGELHVSFDQNINFPFTTGETTSILIKTLTYTPTFLIELILIKNALSHINQAVKLGMIKYYLSMDYVPFARQDRVCSLGDAFSLKAFSEHLNLLSFDLVFIADPHSDVTPALINNCAVSTVLDIFTRNTEVIEQYSHLVSPDAGAYKKTQSLGKEFNKEVIPCLKTRDTATGRLSNTIVVTEGLQEEVKRLLVVDDICDYGRTFLNLGGRLKELYPNVPIDLYITHGIFAKGVEELNKYFDKIYCYNLMNPDVIGVKVIK